METNVNNTCTFIGHRKIEKTEWLYKKIESCVEGLILEKNISVFLFGSKSGFDELCYSAVSKLKHKYPQIKRIYIRSSFQYISDDYQQYLLTLYEDTYYPDELSNAGRASYIIRNKIMIDKSGRVIFYFDKNYIPPQKRQAEKLFKKETKSGTAIAYDYARQKRKNVENLCPD